MRCMHIEIEPTTRQVNHGIHHLIHIYKGMASDVSTLTHTWVQIKYIVSIFFDIYIDSISIRMNDGQFVCLHCGTLF